jgi:hypothetical protein
VTAVPSAKKNPNDETNFVAMVVMEEYDDSEKLGPWNGILVPRIAPRA